MFTQPGSTAILRILKSHTAATASNSPMKNRSPRMSQRTPSTKRGVRWTKRPLSSKEAKFTNQVEVNEEVKSNSPVSKKADPTPAKDKASLEPEKDFVGKAKPSPHPTKEKLKRKDERDSPTVHLGLDSDSENKLVIDLEKILWGRRIKNNKKEPKVLSPT